MPLLEVQECFRSVFLMWGRPQQFRVDNGSPWGSWGDLPPEMALWLIGLGLDMIWNPAHRPQHNGVVERSQGVGKCWAEPGQCHSVAELQERLDHEDRIQREEYPALAGEARMTAYPQLRARPRSYDLAWERRHWDCQRVYDHLATYALGRRVDCSGKIGVYHHKLYVGARHKGLRVYVQFDPVRMEWVVSNEAGAQIYRAPADMLTPQRIKQLKVSKR